MSTKSYYERNKQKILAKVKQRYEEKREEILQQKKEYHLANKDKISKRNKEHRLKNIDKYKERDKNRYLKNKDRLLEQMKKYHKEYYSKEENIKKRKERSSKSYYKNKHNPETIERRRKNAKAYRDRNSEKLNKLSRKYYKENRERLIEQKLEYYANNENACIAKKLRENIRTKFRSQNQRKNRSTMELLGVSILHASKHLEKKFQPGMSWDNHGEWHIDHIIPCASFDLTKPSEQKKCFHYTNLQPLWARENLKKGARLEWRKS